MTNNIHTIHEQEAYDRTLFGFWIYIMTDCILFATLFATYVVLQNGTFGGPTSKDLFNLPFALTETVILLTSSFTSGLVMLAAHRHDRSKVFVALALTFLLGAAFLAMELHEFNQFVQEGHSWRTSAFLSSFFTLVGTHGLHITAGLLWILVMVGQLIVQGLQINTLRRLACFTMFWHFLDVVWIFIFTIVYLLGV